MRSIHSCASVLAFLCSGLVFCAGAAHAVPVLIDYNKIRPKTLEDFENEPVGEFLNPGVFDAFSFTAGAPAIFELETVCRSAGKCLSDNDLPANGTREFFGFHPGTKTFGVHLGWVNPDQFSTMKVTVVGSKQSRTFSGFSTTDRVTSLAFFDKHGLISIAFEISDLPGPFLTNYSFDNVVTSVRPVPVPSTGWLMIFCIAVLNAGRLKNPELG